MQWGASPRTNPGTAQVTCSPELSGRFRVWWPICFVQTSPGHPLRANLSHLALKSAAYKLKLLLGTRGGGSGTEGLAVSPQSCRSGLKCPCLLPLRRVLRSPAQMCPSSLLPSLPGFEGNDFLPVSKAQVQTLHLLLTYRNSGCCLADPERAGGSH